MFKSLHLKNILSFRDTKLELGPLNILIGPNASGKSNLIETIALLRAAPDDLAVFFRRNGPVLDWIWKGKPEAGLGSRIAEITAVLDNPSGVHESERQLTYNLKLAENNERLQVIGEVLENIRPYQPYQPRPYYYFTVENGYGRISPRRAYADERERVNGDPADGPPPTSLTPDNIAPGKSVLSEIRDPVNFPVLTQIARRLLSMKLYRNWNVGRDSPARRPQPTDGAIDFLEEDYSNLALVVNDLQFRGMETLINDHLHKFYESYDNLRPRIHGGTIQLAANETGIRSAIPATRLSDGTMRFIALLTILCHPEPPGLICIEEPEVALHPDTMPLVAELLRTASERTQLVVATHSPDIVDHFTSEPDAIVVCERGFDGDTELNRLSYAELEGWLEDYRLGRLWEKGIIGGNRW